jgi:hypothetical protein
MTPTVLGSLLLPFLLALFYFSNNKQRRTPMFICVLLAVLLCLAQSIQQAVLHVSSTFLSIALIAPYSLDSAQLRMLYNPINTTDLVFTDLILCTTLILELIPNFVADIALYYRMLAVYPFSATPTVKWSLIFAPPIVFKGVRVACWTGFLIALTRPGGQLPHFQWTKEERWWTVTERVFTAVDNA